MIAAHALAALCALAYLALTARPASALRSLVKTAAVAFLALGAALAGAPVWLVVGLAVCALGDWLLSRETERGFMAGIGAFALGHLAYGALFLTHPAADLSRLGRTPWLWGVVALLGLGLVMARGLAPRAGALRGPVLAYIPVILSMGIAAMVLPMQGSLALALPAALGFIASDMVLAVEKFVLRADSAGLRLTPYLVWPLYWGAQAGFVAAFA